MVWISYYCARVSYIYFEHPIVYMYMWVIYRCICTCFMYVLISEVWFKSYMAPHNRKLLNQACLKHHISIGTVFDPLKRGVLCGKKHKTLCWILVFLREGRLLCRHNKLHNLQLRTFLRSRCAWTDRDVWLWNHQRIPVVSHWLR